MARAWTAFVVWLFVACVITGMMSISRPVAAADDGIVAKIDSAIEAAAGSTVGAVADDAELLRRLSLDLLGRVPSSAETVAFLNDSTADKRTTLIDKLTESPEFARRMRDVFHVQLMERAGDHEEWLNYLERSFATNKPWDVMVREMLNPDADNEATRGAAFFLTKRLENYGQQPVDLPGLTRDVGRLFLGVDLQCAQCHDHLTIPEYKQVDFQGLHSFLAHTSIRQDVKFPAVAEKVIDKKTEFSSVFVKEPKSIGPRLPFGMEFEVATFTKGEEFATPPDKKTRFPGKPKFSPLRLLAEQLPTASERAFARNLANRLWWQLMGRGLVHPLDLHHAGNPPSHPEVLDLLTADVIASKYDIRRLLRLLARTRVYQRSSLVPEGATAVLKPGRYVTALEKPLSAEQLLASVLSATGEEPRHRPLVEGDWATKPNPALDELRKRFLGAFANPPREPEGDFAPSVKAALFLSNDSRVLGLLEVRDGNLADRLVKLDDSSQVAEQLFIAVLSRKPTSDETAGVRAFLLERADKRPQAISHLIWSLITSTEFGVNH